jgi:hypothetical protein
MPAMRHLSWENFRATVLVSGQQRVHRISEKPLIELFSDGTAHRIGILIEEPDGTTAPTDVSRLAFISARPLNRKGRRLLELSTGVSGLYRQFYHFALAVAERVTVDRLPPSEAVDLELECFADLLAEKTVLGIERQIGLIGELLFLERLASKLGSSILSSWIGPFGEPHDFRLESREFEVKTTVSPQRTHIINGAEQLVASSGCSLALVSVLLGPPGSGSGFSLTDTVERLRVRFSTESALKDAFDHALSESGFRNEDSPRYSRKFALRRPLATVPVDGAFPAITRGTIQDALGPKAPRVEHIEYEVNVEGLEHEDGSADFESAISN